MVDGIVDSIIGIMVVVCCNALDLLKREREYYCGSRVSRNAEGKQERQGIEYLLSQK